jgi:hypothetical protein
MLCLFQRKLKVFNCAKNLKNLWEISVNVLRPFHDLGKSQLISQNKGWLAYSTPLDCFLFKWLSMWLFFNFDCSSILWMNLISDDWEWKLGGSYHEVIDTIDDDDSFYQIQHSIGDFLFPKSSINWLTLISTQSFIHANLYSSQVNSFLKGYFDD